MNFNEMPRVLSVANQKGGVGKTTTAVNLATAISTVGKKVLLLDLDPQGNATVSVNARRNLNVNSYQVLMGYESIDNAIKETAIPNLYIIGSGKELLGVDIELSQEEKPQYFLLEAIKNTKIKLDYIIIDCPPTLGLLTINALVASSAVLMPIQCEYLALEGVADLTKNIDLVKRNFNPSLEIQGIVLTMFDGRNKLSDMVANDVRNAFGNKVYNTVIPRNIRVSEAPSHGLPVILYDYKCAGSDAYLKLSKEVLKREKELLS
ncbi:MAG: Chromosome partitioning protein ParA [Alphaproteobacteria bacterium ADurb.Bin438]|nr:MAG: Chromosome partitioning protein ParA [Alphaproteobacteria bacterium ADurb.Bin438]